MTNKGLEEYCKNLKAGLVKKIRDKGRPSAIKAIREKCLDCICAETEGRIDCEIEDCSLYFWMPYGRLKKERKARKANQKNEENKTQKSYP